MGEPQAGDDRRDGGDGGEWTPAAPGAARPGLGEDVGEAVRRVDLEGAQPQPDAQPVLGGSEVEVVHHASHPARRAVRPRCACVFTEPVLMPSAAAVSATSRSR